MPLSSQLISLHLRLEAEPFVGAILKSLGQHASVEAIVSLSTEVTEPLTSMVHQYCGIEEAKESQFGLSLVLEPFTDLEQIEAIVLSITKHQCVAFSSEQALIDQLLEFQQHYEFLPVTKPSWRQAMAGLFTENRILRFNNPQSPLAHVGFYSPSFALALSGSERHFESLNTLFESLHHAHIPYAVIHFGSPLSQLGQEKDIEILTPQVRQMVDLLGAKPTNKSSVFRVALGANSIKLDFYHSLHLPHYWRLALLSQPRWSEEGCYTLSAVDQFWVHLYERTLLKPHKFANDERYPNGGGWSDLIQYGKELGVTPMPQLEWGRMQYLHYLRQYLNTRFPQK